MILKSVTIVKDRALASFLSAKIQNHSLLELLPFSDQPIDSILSYSSAIDIVFFEVTKSTDGDLERILRLSSQFKSVVLILSRNRFDLYTHYRSDIEFMFHPITDSQFDVVIQKIENKIPSLYQNKFMTRGEFMIKNILKNETVCCYYGEITVIEVLDKSLTIHTVANGTIEAHGPLSRIEKWLEPIGIFYRVHKSYIISIDHLESIAGDLVKIRYYDRLIKLGARYRKRFDEFSESITYH